MPPRAVTSYAPGGPLRGKEDFQIEVQWELLARKFDSELSEHSSPNQSTVARITDLTDRTNTEIAANLAAITTYQRFIHYLSNRNTNLERRIVTGKKYLSTLRTFPTELLTAIFVRALEDGVEHIGSHMKSPATELGLVCKRWRGIIEKKPTFWTRISWSSYRSFSFPENKLKGKQAFKRLSNVLLKSKNLKLHLYLTVQDPNDAVITQLLEILSTHSHRFESLYIDLDNDVVYSFIDHANLLQNLNVLTKLGLNFRIQQGDGLAFENAPNLRSALLSGFVQLPWTQLRELTFHEPFELFAMLSECTHIEKLTFWELDRENDFEWSGDEDPVDLPLLKTLVFHLGPTMQEANIFQIIAEAPNLSNITLYYTSEAPFSEFFEPALITDFQGRQQCQIRYLTLFDVPIKVEKFVKLLVALHDLDTLKIIETSEISDEVLLLTPSFFNEVLHFDEEKQVVLPRLQQLDIYFGHQPETFPKEACLRALSSRISAKGDSRLNSVQLEVPGLKLASEDHTLIKRMIAAGVQVKVCTVESECEIEDEFIEKEPTNGEDFVFPHSLI